ncbi:MAG: proline racemase family protein [Phycisphaerales bacterium]
MKRVRAVDSHTEGEPTRVFHDLGAFGAPRPVGEWLRAWRTPDGGWQVPTDLLALVAEPRAAPATVGAILCPPSRPEFFGGVIFFNSAGALGMCGHGTIGLAATLRYQRTLGGTLGGALGGALGEGEHRFETPVGPITTRLTDDSRVEVDNVESYRHQAGVVVNVGGRAVRGDIAWGGNWFFLVDEDRDLDLARLDAQLAHTHAIRAALDRDRVTGANGATIDHVALFGKPIAQDADSRNFVLCPNGSYDRSPCGTGTSAKLACLAADRRLAPGQVWRQESVLGSRFDAWYRPAADGRVAPTIRGRAWITAETTVLADPDDPARAGGWIEPVA